MNASVVNPTILILGNKREVEVEKNVSDKLISELKSTNKNIIFKETSARTGFNINESFRVLAEEMMKKGNLKKESGVKL